MKPEKIKTIQQRSATAQVLVEGNMNRDIVPKVQGAMTHLGMEMTYQVQQLLHTPLKGRRVMARLVAQGQGMGV